MKIIIINLSDFTKQIYDSSISETDKKTKAKKKSHLPKRIKKSKGPSWASYEQIWKLHRLHPKTKKKNKQTKENKGSAVTKTQENPLETPKRKNLKKRWGKVCVVWNDGKSVRTLCQKKYLQSQVAISCGQSRLSMRQVQRILKRKSRRVPKVDGKAVRS